jgi:type IV fimbrial biogenesis protein FimT
MAHARRKHPNGFTLIDLVLAMLVAAILVGMTLSSYASARAAARTEALRQALLGAILDARSAAVVHGRDTLLCPSADGEDCTGGFEWQHGFIAAVDSNNNERVDSADVHLFHTPGFDDVRLLTSSGRTQIQFQPSGSNSGSNATFTFCDSRGPKKAKSLLMNNRGEMREEKPTAVATAAACRI